MERGTAVASIIVFVFIRKKFANDIAHVLILTVALYKHGSCYPIRVVW